MSHREMGALVIIFDVGKSVSTPLPEENKTFFEKSRDCISWILRRKILSMSKDIVSILLTGTDEEGESLNDIDVTPCRNFTMKYDFQLASWEMLHYIDNEVKQGNKLSDWVGTLSVAIEKLKIYEQSSKLSSKTIVVFSDLNYAFTEAVGSVLMGIKSYNIEVNFIGSESVPQVPKDKEFSNEEPPTKKHCLREHISELENGESINGQKLLYIMWHWAGDLITVCNFNSAMRHLSCYIKKKSRATPWNCVMDIGDFQISVQVFKKVNRKLQYCHNLKFQRVKDSENTSGISGSELSEVKRDKIMYYKHSDPSSFETKEISVGEEDVIAGYRYGTSIIPFSDEDKLILGYKSGKKCFTILGFTHVDNIPYYALVGEGCYIVAPREKDECAEVSFSALVQAMSETGNVAIVRRVYSEDRGLCLGVLYPVVEQQAETNYKECLIFIEVAFHEEIRIIGLPRLRRIKSRISEEQYKIIDNLIDEMNLMKSQSGEQDEVYEELDLSTRHEVKNQFFAHCITQKALYPNKHLPNELPQHCRKSITLPDLVSNKSQKFDKELQELFSAKVKGVESVNSVITSNNNEKFMEISFYTSVLENEKTAESCFRKLFDVYGYPPAEEIRNLLELCIKSFHFKEEEIVEAFLKLTHETRQKTIEHFTDDYNYWMRRLRIHLGMDKQLERNYWNGVLEGNLGLITEEEHRESCTKKVDADFFIDSIKASNEKEEERRQIAKEEEEAINMLF